MVLVVGYGNTLRRDDGAGVVLVERMAQEWFESDIYSITAHQLTPELAQEIAEQAPDAVVFVDACVVDKDHRGQVALEKIDIEAEAPGMGHHLNPQVVMTYARLLFGAQANGWVLSLPGVDFAHGEGLSDQANAAVRDGQRLLRELFIDLGEGPHAA